MTIHHDNFYGNGKVRDLLPGETGGYHNPVDYQSIFPHTKWKKTMKGKKFSMIDFVADMPKPVAKLFAEIDINRKRGTNTADLGSPVDSSGRSKAFKHLRKLKVAKRAGRNKFMISPGFRIPSGTSIIRLVDEWNSLEPTDETLVPPPIKKKPPITNT